METLQELLTPLKTQTPLPFEYWNTHVYNIKVGVAELKPHLHTKWLNLWKAMQEEKA